MYEGISVDVEQPRSVQTSHCHAWIIPCDLCIPEGNWQEDERIWDMISDILIEANLITSGCLKGVLSGKHYSRTILCHKTLAEALERLLFQQFVEREEKDNPLLCQPIDVFAEILKDMKTDRYGKLHNNTKLQGYISRYRLFREKVASGLFGKTAQFWISYIDNVWLILCYMRAVKVNDLPLYAHCLYEMSDLFFAFDCQNYSRYGTYFSVFLSYLVQHV